MLTWFGNASTAQKEAYLDTKATHPFYLADGTTLYTLRDFSSALVSMHQSTFEHHVHEERNDFSNWLAGCFSAPISSLGETIRGKNRQDVITLFVHALQSKPSQAMQSAPMNAAAIHDIYEQHAHAQQRQPALPPVLPPPVRAAETPVSKPLHHAHTPSAPAIHSPQHVQAAAKEKIELHPKALPPSPLHQLHMQRVKAAHDKLEAIRIEAAHDAIQAKESFIEVRTHIWRDLADEERRMLLPQLREVYDMLVKAH